MCRRLFLNRYSHFVFRKKNINNKNVDLFCHYHHNRQFIIKIKFAIDPYGFEEGRPKKNNNKIKNQKEGKGDNRMGNIL